MIEFTYVITDPEGLHARPVTRLCSEALAWSSSISVTCGAVTASAADPIGLMGLMARCGDELAVAIEGPDEFACSKAIRAVLDA